MTSITFPLAQPITLMEGGYQSPLSNRLNKISFFEQYAIAREIKTRLKAIKAHDFNLKQHQTLIVAALKTAYFAPVENELIRLLNPLKSGQIDDLCALTKELLQAQNCDELLKRWIPLTSTIESLNDFFRELNQNFDALKVADAVIVNFQDKFKFSSTEPNTSLIASLKHSLLNFLKIVIYCASLINLGSEPTNFIEAKTMLDVWHSFYLIPVAIFTALAFFIPPLIALGTTVALVVTVGLASYLYYSKFAPLPEKLPFCELKKPGEVNAIVGRTFEQKKLATNLESSSKCQLIVGQPGIGKTSLALSMTNEFPHKKVFYCHIPGLIAAQTGFSLLTPLEQIRKKIGRHGPEMLLIWDEIDKAFEPQNQILGQQLMALFDSSSKEGVAHSIGITTEELYKKSAENLKKQVTSISLTDRRFLIFPLQPTDTDATLDIIRKRCEELALVIEDELVHKICDLEDPRGISSHPDLALDILDAAHQRLTALQKGEKRLPESVKNTRVISTASSTLDIDELCSKAAEIHAAHAEIASISSQIDQEKALYAQFYRQNALLKRIQRWTYDRAKKLTADSPIPIAKTRNLFLAHLLVGINLQSLVEKARTELPYLKITNQILEDIIQDRFVPEEHV